MSCPQMLAALDGGSEWFAPATERDRLRGRRTRCAQPRAPAPDTPGSSRRPARRRTSRAPSSRPRRRPRSPACSPAYHPESTASSGIACSSRQPTTSSISSAAGTPTDSPPSWQRAAPLTSARRRRPPVLRRVQGRVRRHRLHRRDACGGAEFVASTTSPSACASPPTSRRGIPGSFVYLYAPDLDAIGHKRGWQSDEWVAALEQVDAAARTSRDALAPGTGVGGHGRPRHGRRARGTGTCCSPTATTSSRVSATSAASRGCCTSTPSPATAAAVLDALARGRGSTFLGALARRGDRRRPVRRRGSRRRPRASATSSSPLASGIAYYDDRLDDKGAQRDGRAARLAHGRGADRAARSDSARSR